MTAPIPNAALAYRVLDWIDAHPEQHDQARWFQKTACGTAGCFAGWTVVLAGHRVGFDEMPDEDGVQRYDTIDGTRLLSVAGVAIDDLGIATSTVECQVCESCGQRDRADDALFAASNSREDLGRLVEEIFGPRPESYGTGCHCDYLGEGTPEHTPSALCRSLRPDAERESC